MFNDGNSSTSSCDFAQDCLLRHQLATLELTKSSHHIYDLIMGSPKTDVDAKPPCHPRACAIQDCLTRNNYNDAKCQDVVKALYECCDAFYQKNGDDATTPSCPKPSLLRLKMEQMNQH